MAKLTAMNHLLRVDEIQTLVPWLTGDDRAMQQRALAHLAGHARAELADVPKYWRFMFQAYPKDVLDIRAEYDKKGLPYPQWRLDVLSAPDGVTGLIHAMDTYDHRKARRWRFAALLLWHCMLATKTGDRRVISFIPTLALRCDAERGQRELADRRKGGRATSRSDSSQLRAAYFELRPNKKYASDALRAVAKRYNVSTRTVRRAFEAIGQNPP